MMLKTRQLILISVARLCLITSLLSCGEAEQRSRVIHGFVQINGGKLYYEETGSGHPVVLLGGGGMMDLRQWDIQFDYLGKKFNTIRVDPRGLGKSDLPTSSFSNAADLKVLLDSLQIEGATIVGLSYAGGIALEFAILYPERICGLVCSGPLVTGWQFSEGQQKRMSVFAEAAQQGPDRFIEVAFQDRHFIPAPQNPKARDRARLLIPDNFRSFDPALLQQLVPPVVARVSKIETSTLLIVGELDHPDIHHRVDFLNQTIKNSRKVVVEGSGHIVNMERPQIFNNIVAEFIDRLQCN